MFVLSAALQHTGYIATTVTVAFNESTTFNDLRHKAHNISKNFLYYVPFPNHIPCHINERSYIEVAETDLWQRLSLAWPGRDM